MIFVSISINIVIQHLIPIQQTAVKPTVLNSGISHNEPIYLNGRKFGKKPKIKFQRNQIILKNKFKKRVFLVQPFSSIRKNLKFSFKIWWNAKFMKIIDLWNFLLLRYIIVIYNPPSRYKPDTDLNIELISKFLTLTV